MNFGLMSKVFNVMLGLDFGKNPGIDSVNQTLDILKRSPDSLNDGEKDIIVQIRKVCAEYNCSLDESINIFDLCKTVLKKGSRPGDFYSSDDHQVDGMILSRSAFHALLEGYVKNAIVEHSVLQPPVVEESDHNKQDQQNQTSEDKDVTSQLADLNLDLLNTYQALELIAVTVSDHHEPGNWFMNRLDSSLYVLSDNLQRILDQYEDLYVRLCNAEKSESVID